MDTIPSEIIEYGIFHYIPLIDLYSLDPNAKIMKSRVKEEWKDFEPYLDAIEEDNLDFLLLLLSQSTEYPICDEDLPQLVFSTKAEKIINAIFSHKVFPQDMFLGDLIEFALDKLSPETIMSFSDEHFIQAMKYLGCSGDTIGDEHYLCQLTNFGLLEKFLQRILDLEAHPRDTIPWFLSNHYWHYQPEIIEKYLGIPKNIKHCCHTGEYSQRLPHRCDSVGDYRKYLQSLEERRYQPEIYNRENHPLFWMKNTNFEILVPKLIENRNFDALWLLLKSPIVGEEKLALGKYLGMLIDQHSLLAHLLSSKEHFDWDLLLSLPNTSSIPNLPRDLEILIPKNQHGHPSNDYITYIQSFIELPLWFLNLFPNL